MYDQWREIIAANYSQEKICLLEVATDRMFEELDKYVASGLECDEEFSTKVPYDQEMDFDFPEPPEICQ